MIQVMEGSPEDFSAMLFGATKHPGTIQYLENQFNTMSQTLNDFGRSFLANTREIYERFNGSAAMEAARAALRKANQFWQAQDIRPMYSLEEIQNASYVMQRWIMANPTVRSLYHQQRCDGYADQYVDMFPGQIGSNHYDYRRVMTNILVDGKPEDDFEWHAVIYEDELLEGDRALSFSEKLDILSTWDLLESYFQKKEDDPTSPHGGKL